jgi:hypothetical protein
MRKILSIGVFLCAAVLVAALRAGASASPGPEAARAVVWLEHDGFCGAMEAPMAPARRAEPVARVRSAWFGAADFGRGYGVMLMLLVMPTAVLGWGVWRTARMRARSEV